MSHVLKLSEFARICCVYVVLAILTFLWIDHDNNQDHRHWGHALPGKISEIVQTGKENGKGYTQVAIYVIAPNNAYYHYPKVNLKGERRDGQNVRAWLYDNNSDHPAFEYEYDAHTPSHFPAYPWYSWFTVLWLSLLVASAPTLILLVIYVVCDEIFKSLKKTSARAKKRGLLEGRVTSS